MTNTELFDLWRARAVEDPDLLTELDGIRGDADAINDRFYRDLAFGTGGLRGVIGAGSNRMNIYTIRRATQGLADYINAAGLPKKVAIGHDSRHKGEPHALVAARGLHNNGIRRQLAPLLGTLDHLQRRARLHRAAHVHRLELHEHLGVVGPGHAPQPHERRRSHGFQNVIADHSFP